MSLNSKQKNYSYQAYPLLTCPKAFECTTLELIEFYFMMAKKQQY